MRACVWIVSRPHLGFARFPSGMHARMTTHTSGHGCGHAHMYTVCMTCIIACRHASVHASVYVQIYIQIMAGGIKSVLATIARHKDSKPVLSLCLQILALLTARDTTREALHTVSVFPHTSPPPSPLSLLPSPPALLDRTYARAHNPPPPLLLPFSLRPSLPCLFPHSLSLSHGRALG